MADPQVQQRFNRPPPPTGLPAPDLDAGIGDVDMDQLFGNGRGYQGRAGLPDDDEQPRRRGGPALDNDDEEMFRIYDKMKEPREKGPELVDRMAKSTAGRTNLRTAGRIWNSKFMNIVKVVVVAAACVAVPPAAPAILLSALGTKAAIGISKSVANAVSKEKDNRHADKYKDAMNRLKRTDKEAYKRYQQHQQFQRHQQGRDAFENDGNPRGSVANPADTQGPRGTADNVVIAAMQGQLQQMGMQMQQMQMMNMQMFQQLISQGGRNYVQGLGQEAQVAGQALLHPVQTYQQVQQQGQLAQDQTQAIPIATPATPATPQRPAVDRTKGQSYGTPAPTIDPAKTGTINPTVDADKTGVINPSTSTVGDKTGVINPSTSTVGDKTGVIDPSTSTPKTTTKAAEAIAARPANAAEQAAAKKVLEAALDGTDQRSELHATIKAAHDEVGRVTKKDATGKDVVENDYVATFNKLMGDDDAAKAVHRGVAGATLTAQDGKDLKSAIGVLERGSSEKAPDQPIAIGKAWGKVVESQGSRLMKTDPAFAAHVEAKNPTPAATVSQAIPVGHGASI
jgi:hypothetical protein